MKIAIDNLSGNEYVLYNLGIKDVEGFISKVNHVWNTPKSDERYLNEFNILYDFLDGSNNSELTISFIIVSCLRVGQNYFLNRLEDFSFEEFIRDSKKWNNISTDTNSFVKIEYYIINLCYVE